MTDPNSKPTAGALLVAPPTLRDLNFYRSVVLLCEHGEMGSFGLILNRPLKVGLGEILSDHEGDDMVSLGGPVQQDTLHYLHRHGDIVGEAVPVAQGIHWGGDFQAIKILMDTQMASPQDLRFFVGYAGWSPGQLEAEISDGGWFQTWAHDTLVFSEDPEDLWRTVLQRMGGEYALLVNFPDNPRVN